MFDSLVAKGFQVEFHSHAKAIVGVDFPQAVSELEAALSASTIPIEEIIAGGGGESKSTQRLRKALARAGWPKFTFTVEKRINGVPRESVSHEMDHVRTFPGGLAFQAAGSSCSIRSWLMRSLTAKIRTAASAG